MIKIAIWWAIPCKSILPVCRELANFNDVEVSFIAQNDLSENRKKLGWQIPEIGKIKYSLLSENLWKNEVDSFLIKDFHIHIFNGIYLYKKLRTALDKAIDMGLNIGIISEAPHNPYNGLLRPLKSFYTNLITPYRVKSRASKCKFVLSASGNEVKKFIKLGWKQDQIFPFGYFPDSKLLETEKIFHEPYNLLSTGYLTKNKGHKLLIKALAEVKKVGIKFNCIITGYGPEYNKLIRLTEKLALQNEINFVGTVPDEELDKLKQETHLFIAPGYEEPWGIRINEAILAGIPVISSDKIGACELIKIGDTGTTFSSGNYKDLAGKIIELLSNVNLLKQKHINSMNYRKIILPNAAANYMLDVIKGSLFNSSPKLRLPPWL